MEVYVSCCLICKMLTNMMRKEARSWPSLPPGLMDSGYRSVISFLLDSLAEKDLALFRIAVERKVSDAHRTSGEVTIVTKWQTLEVSLSEFPLETAIATKLAERVLLPWADCEADIRESAVPHPPPYCIIENCDPTTRFHSSFREPVRIGTRSYMTRGVVWVAENDDVIVTKMNDNWDAINDRHVLYLLLGADDC